MHTVIQTHVIVYVTLKCGRLSFKFKTSNFKPNIIILHYNTFEINLRIDVNIIMWITLIIFNFA